MAHLTHSQRTLIESGLKQRDSFKEIARKIGKSPSSVSREVLKHRVDSDKGAYGRITNRCIYRRNCERLRVCDSNCSKRCSACTKCNASCPNFEEEICERLSLPPYVCNGCKDEYRCVLKKKFYVHDHAQEDEVSLKEVVLEIESLMQAIINEKNLHFEIREDIVDNYVFCDKLRLNQVLINLLGNAVKFTPEGGSVTLDIKQETVAPEGYGVYFFKVKDTGIGIAKDFHDKIFEAFEREKVTEQSGIQGTGLGLAITKNIVEMMGGRISLESEIGKGTEFTVKVMFALLDVDEDEMIVDSFEKKEEKLEKERKERKDLFRNRKIVEEAVNGQEAVDILSHAEDSEYALILMDIQMPVMDGYETTKMIRNLPNRALAHTPIIAMTANAFEEEKKKALSCGMNGHVSKPIDINVLFKTIEGIMK